MLRGWRQCCQLFRKHDMPHNYSITIREINADDHLSDERVIPFEKPPRLVVDKKSLFSNKLHYPTKVFFHTHKPIKSPCNYSMAIMEQECLFEFTSYVPMPHKKEEKPRAWGHVLRYGVNAEFIGNSSFQQVEGREEIVCKQALKISLMDDSDWGIVQLRCQSTKLRYRSLPHRYNDVLTYFFYRDLESLNRNMFPPMLIANRFYGQNYFPVLPGQLLMVVAGNDFVLHDMQDEEYKCLRLEDEQTVGNKFAAIYHCVDIPQVKEVMLVSNDVKNHHIGVFLPTVYKYEKLTYIIVLEPRDCVYVNCENINALCIKFINEIPIISRNEKITIDRVDTEEKEVLLLLSSDLQGLHMVKKNGRLEFEGELR